MLSSQTLVRATTTPAPGSPTAHDLAPVSTPFSHTGGFGFLGLKADPQAQDATAIQSGLLNSAWLVLVGMVSI